MEEERSRTRWVASRVRNVATLVQLDPRTIELFGANMGLSYGLEDVRKGLGSAVVERVF